jgi:hypothetical protein
VNIMLRRLWEQAVVVSVAAFPQNCSGRKVENHNENELGYPSKNRTYALSQTNLEFYR